MKNNSVKILIVDDDKEYCVGMVDILQAKGYEVESENSGAAAIAKVKETSFDVILMDIKMPVMNGVEAFKHIKQISPKTAVIMITAYALEDLIKEALHEGAFGVLQKPIDIEKLIEQIKLAHEGGIFILVTDDDPNTRVTFKDVLEAKGYKVSTASSGEEAVRMSRERPSDIMFLDMELTAINGLETHLQIKEINPRVVTVIITGYYEEMKDVLDNALEKGVYTVLKKPLDMDKVIGLIEEIRKKINK